jgi:Ca2+-binding RTX toxin-like protein
MSTITVGSTAGLNAALKTALSGDTILLAPGTYSGLSIKGIDTGGLVTIKSLDPNNEAVLTNFNISHSSGLKFQGVEMAASGGVGYYSWIIRDSQNIHFDDVNIHGSMDGNPQNDAAGIQVFDSSDVSIINAEFQQLYRGVAFSESNNITVSGNEFHDTARTAIFSQNVQKVTIVDNSFTNFRPAEGDHMDAIAFTAKSDGTNTTQDIFISGNVITRGDGKVAQGIFFRDPSGVTDFKNIQIVDNIIVGMGYNGIYVNGADNVKVDGNQVLSYEGKANTSWILVQNVDGVAVTNNAASLISVLGSNGNTAITDAGNTIVDYVTDGGVAAVQAFLNNLGGIQSPVWDAALPRVPEPIPTPTPTPTPIPTPEAVPTPSPTPTAGQVIFGSSKANTLFGTNGDDTIDGRGGADVLHGGAGNDTYYVPNSLATVVEKAGEGVDTVVAKGNHILGDNVENLTISDAGINGWSGTGNELNNQIVGNAGPNTLDGKAGADTIFGGLGNDVIIGGKGDDLLIGGPGNDIFRFVPGDGRDVIRDFSVGDQIDIYAYVKAGITVTVQDAGADVVLNFSNGDAITLIGVEPSLLKSVYYGFVG